jgi:hypothetical protein
MSLHVEHVTIVGQVDPPTRYALNAKMNRMNMETGIHKIITCGKETLIFDSQRIAEKLGRPRETVKANCMIQIVAATGHEINSFALHRQIEAKHKQIEYDEEKKRMIFQRCNEFMKDYAPINDNFITSAICT